MAVKYDVCVCRFSRGSEQRLIISDYCYSLAFSFKRGKFEKWCAICWPSQTECVWQRLFTVPDRMCMTALLDHPRQNVYDNAHWPSETECVWQCSLTVRDRTCMTVLVDPPRQNVHERLLAKSGVLGQKVHIQTACCISWHNAFYTRLK